VATEVNRDSRVVKSTVLKLIIEKNWAEHHSSFLLFYRF